MEPITGEIYVSNLVGLYQWFFNKFGLRKVGILPMTLERYLEPLNASLDFLFGAANFLVKQQLFLGCQLRAEGCVIFLL